MDTLIAFTKVDNQTEVRISGENTGTVDPIHRAIVSAESAKKRGDYEGAVRIYKAALREHGKSAALWLGLAMTHSYFANYEEARVSVAKALSLEPKNPMALYAQGSILNMLNRPSEAFASLNNALRQMWTSTLPAPQKKFLMERIYIALGYASCNLGDIDGALNYTETALKINPKSNVARSNIGSYYLFKSPDFFQTWYSKAEQVFRTVDQIGYLKEKAVHDYSSSRALELGKDLALRIMAESSKVCDKNPQCQPLKIYPYIRSTILKYPKDKVPYMVNAYWQNFITYIPDPIEDNTKEWNYKDPRLLAVQGWGDCDDMIMLADDIFNAAGITHANITYKYNLGGAHDICAFKNTNGKWDYIDSDGIYDIGAASLHELMGLVRLVPIERSAKVFIVRDHRQIKTETINFK